MSATTANTAANPAAAQQQPQPTGNAANTAAAAAAANGAYSGVSLYVGDLNADINETQLYEVFKAVGPVASIRVCRDAVTRRSLGYAYVNYHNPQDARNALESLNYKDVKGRPCRIMYSQRDPSLRKQGTGNIFIKNLDETVDNKALYDTFSAFGTILSCKVALDENGQNRGYAFVHYETEEAATKAIETVNGKLLAGKKCYVARFIPAKERAKELAKSPKWTNVFVKNMPKAVNEQRMRELFGKFGKITSAVIKVKRNEAKGEEKAFGFINYDTHEEAARAVDEMNGKEIDGEAVFVGKAQKKAEREKELRAMFEKLKRERLSKYQGVNLFVKNLDETLDDEKVRQEFVPFGTITSAKVMRDEKGTSKGFGFVCFTTPEEATKAVTEMNGKMLVSKPIYVALAERKDQRRTKLEHQYQQRALALRMQAPGAVPGAPVYPSPVYYTGRGTFMYPTMIPRGRFPPRGGFAGGQQGMPGYMVAPGSGVPQGAARGGPGGRGGRGGRAALPGAAPGGNQMALKYNPNVRNPQQPQPAAAQASGADTKQMMGEKLYHQITGQLSAEQQPLAGKITGMLLESLSMQELNGLTDDTSSLNLKIAEALEVLESTTKK